MSIPRVQKLAQDFRSHSASTDPLLHSYCVAYSFNITSSRFSGIILVVQCITASPLRTYVNIFTDTPGNIDYNLFVKLFFSPLEFINLDFFHLVYSPVCLHPKLEVACFDYIIALYPFLLIFFTYILITAYDRRYRVLILIWRPFKKCITRPGTYTHPLLSSIKILRASNKILSWTIVYDVTGKKVDTIVSTSTNVKYFSSLHLPFALLAIAISLILVVLPLFLLIIYPCRCFHWCLNSCGLRLQTLHIFMDAFQGSYKLHPCDMRYFSAFYLFLHVLMFVHAELFPSPMTLYISGIITLASAILIALFQPYKVNAHNSILNGNLLYFMQRDKFNGRFKLWP